MAGKGSKWRVGVDFKKYMDNLSVLSGTDNTFIAKTEKRKNGKVTYTYKQKVLAND